MFSVTETFVITIKGFEPATSCVRDQDATTVPARHMWETGSFNWTLFMRQWFIIFLEFNESSSPFRKNSIGVLVFMYVSLVHWKRDKLSINVPSNLTGNNCLFAGTSGQNQNVGTTDKSLTSYNYPLYPASGVENKNSICFKLTALSWFDLIYWLSILGVFSYYGPHLIHINPTVSQLIRIILLHIWLRFRWKDDGTDMNELTHFSYKLSSITGSIFTFPTRSILLLCQW